MPRDKAIPDMVALKTEVKFLIYDIEQREIKQEHQVLSNIQEIFNCCLDLNMISINKIIKLDLTKFDIDKNLIYPLSELKEVIKDIRNGNIDLLDNDCKEENLVKLANRLKSIFETRVSTRENSNVGPLNESIKFVIFDIEMLGPDEINEYNILKDLIQIYSDAVEKSANMTVKQVIRHNLQDSNNLASVVVKKLEDIKSIIKDIKSCFIDLYSNDPEEKDKLLNRLRQVQEINVVEKINPEEPKKMVQSAQAQDDTSVMCKDFLKIIGLYAHKLYNKQKIDDENLELEAPEYYNEEEDSPYCSELKETDIKNRKSSKKTTPHKMSVNHVYRATQKVTDQLDEELVMLGEKDDMGTSRVSQGIYDDRKSLKSSRVTIDKEGVRYMRAPSMKSQEISDREIEPAKNNVGSKKDGAGSPQLNISVEKSKEMTKTLDQNDPFYNSRPTLQAYLKEKKANEISISKIDEFEQLDIEPIRKLSLSDKEEKQTIVSNQTENISPDKHRSEKDSKMSPVKINYMSNRVENTNKKPIELSYNNDESAMEDIKEFVYGTPDIKKNTNPVQNSMKTKNSWSLGKPQFVSQPTHIGGGTSNKKPSEDEANNAGMQEKNDFAFGTPDINKDNIFTNVQIISSNGQNLVKPKLVSKPTHIPGKKPKPDEKSLTNSRSHSHSNSPSNSNSNRSNISNSFARPVIEPQSLKAPQRRKKRMRRKSSIGEGVYVNKPKEKKANDGHTRHIEMDSDDNLSIVLDYTHIERRKDDDSVSGFFGSQTNIFTNQYKDKSHSRHDNKDSRHFGYRSRSQSDSRVPVEYNSRSNSKTNKKEGSTPFQQHLFEHKPDCKHSQAQQDKELNGHIVTKADKKKVIKEQLEYLVHTKKRFKDTEFDKIELKKQVNDENNIYHDMKDSEFKSLGNHLFPSNIVQVENTPYAILLQNFDQREIFNFKGQDLELTTILCALSEKPQMIKSLFLQTEINSQGLYVLEVYHRGQKTCVVIDDYVMVDSKNYDKIKFCSPDIICQKNKGYNMKIDIWPQLVAKALAKHYNSYIKLKDQNIPGLLKTLTGMPVVVHEKLHRLIPKQIRQNWKKKYIVLAQASKRFIEKYVPSKKNSNQAVYCHQIHALNVGLDKKIPEKTFWLKFKCFSDEINIEHEFAIKQEAFIAEDLKKQDRPIKDKDEDKSFWVNWLDFRKYFDKLYIVYAINDPVKKQMDFEISGSNYFGCKLTVKNSQTQAYLELEQTDKVFEEKKFIYSSMRLYILSVKSEKNREGYKLIRAIQGVQQREILLEEDLSAGKYIIILESEVLKKPRNFTFIIHHRASKSVILETEKTDKIMKCYRDMLFNITKITGTKFCPDESFQAVTRQDLNTKNLGLSAFLYKNDHHKIVYVKAKFYITGEYFCEIDWESLSSYDQEKDGILKLKLKPKSYKLVIFKFNKKAGEKSNKIVPSTSLVKDNLN